MERDRWDRIQALFHELVDLPENERAAALEILDTDDPSVASEVRSLLNEDDRGSFLDRGLPSIAASVMSPQVKPDEHLPQHQFGAYRITGILGEGGMGVVYLGVRDDIGGRAAIKILRDAWLSPARRERFLAEQKTLARLEHSSIARLYDSGTLNDGTPWFVMEHVEGVPITEYCRTHSSTIQERLSLFRAVCEAVQFAHSNLVIHRDLKPSNILVREDRTVKLLDFGISKQLETLDPQVDQTRTAVRMMTPAYASPEQLKGDPVGLPSDIYSLGVVLYELLVGRLPFDLAHHSAADAERIVLEREPEKPSAAARRMELVTPGAAHVRSLGRSGWSELDVICLTALQKDPARRYGTVESLMRDLDHFEKQEALEARPDSAAYRLSRFARRNRAVLAGSSLVVAALVGLTAFYTTRLSEARDTALEEAARSQRLQRFTVNLLRGGDEEVGPADSLRVVSIIDRGVREARSLNHEPVLQAELFATLGGIYRQLGKLDEADTLLGLALDRKRKLFGADSRDVGETLVEIGMVHHARAHFDSAEALVSRGLEMTRRHVPANHPAIARATTQLGQVFEEKGEYDKAIAVLDQGLRIESAKAAMTPEHSAMLTGLANVYFYKGDYARSDTLNRRVLAMDRQVHGPKHPTVADDLINLGAIQFEFGNYAEAERYYREALAITRPWYGNSHPATASNLTMLGRTLVSQSRLDEGSRVLTEALAINERAFGPVHPRVASALNELGRVAQQQGRLDDAEASFRRMAQIYKTVYNDKHYYIGVALSNIGGVLKDRGQYADAARLFEEVLRRYGETLEPDHQLVGIARVRYAEVLVLQKRYGDAEREAASGYRIISAQDTPPPLWLNRARAALAASTPAR